VVHSYIEISRDSGLQHCSLAAADSWDGYVYSLNHQTKSAPLKKECGVDQGDPAAPKHFVVGLDVAMAPVVQLWQREKRGILLDDGMVLTHVAFADNVWTISVSMEDCRRKMLELDDCLHVAGWKIKLKEVAWCSTPYCVEAAADSTIDFGVGRSGCLLANQGFQSWALCVPSCLPPLLPCGIASTRLGPRFGVIAPSGIVEVPRVCSAFECWRS
jgi:hypothetical protein